jgi:hypothetical protein
VTKVTLANECGELKYQKQAAGTLVISKVDKQARAKERRKRCLKNAPISIKSKSRQPTNTSVKSAPRQVIVGFTFACVSSAGRSDVATHRRTSTRPNTFTRQNIRSCGRLSPESPGYGAMSTRFKPVTWQHKPCLLKAIIATDAPPSVSNPVFPALLSISFGA